MALSDNYYLIPKAEASNIAKALKAKGIESPFIGSDFDKKIHQLPSLKPFYHTEIPYDENKASQIVSVAQSYLDAITDGRLVIVYQAGYSTLDGEHQVLKNENGVYVIQCSAFAGLVLRGIAYENSPFYSGDGSKTSARTDLFEWANSDYEKGNVTSANGLAHYAYQNGCILNSNNSESIKKGDILFFSKPDYDYFGGIWHIAIALKDKGTKCVHALYGKSTAIWTFDINSVNYGNLMYIARPRYNIDFSDIKDEYKLEIIEHPTNQTGVSGSNAIFKVVAQGDGLTYQWQYAKSNTPDNWYNSSFDGYDTDTQIVGIASYRNGDRYRCIVTDVYGNSVISNPATIIMI